MIQSTWKLYQKEENYIYPRYSTIYDSEDLYTTFLFMKYFAVYQLIRIYSDLQ